MIKIYSRFGNRVYKSQINQGNIKSNHCSSNTQTEPILFKETSSSNDPTVYDTQCNPNPPLPRKRPLNGFLGHMGLSLHHRNQTSLTSYSNKTDKTAKRIIPFTSISAKSTTIQPDKMKKTKGICKSKDDKIDFIYKKMFLYTLRMHKYKERFHFDNISNINHTHIKAFSNNSKAIQRNKSKSNANMQYQLKETPIAKTIDSVNKKIGFMKGVIDYCYPSQFVLKIKESQRILNMKQQKTFVALDYTSEGNLSKSQNHKRKRFTLLKKSIIIHPLPRLCGNE